MSESSTTNSVPKDQAAPSDDPILVKRARMAALASAGIRIGMFLYAIASVAFFYAVATEFTEAAANVAAFGLLAGSVFLAPAMVLKYTVKAADRADREGSW